MLTKNPFFSIITVVFNDITGLISTEQSIRIQKFSDYEWIIIDGASQDGCFEYLKSINFQGIKILSEPDNGIYDAMNKGIILAEGEYTVFLNAGDIFPQTDILSSVHNKISDNEKSPDVLFGGASLVMPSGKIVYRPPKNMNTYIWHGLPSIHQSTYFRTELLKKHPYDTNYRITGDYYLISTLYNNDIKYILHNESLVNFRVGDTSFKHPVRLIRESYKVQKDVLKINPLKRAISFLKKIIAFTGLFMIAKDLIPSQIVNLVRKN